MTAEPKIVDLPSGSTEPQDGSGPAEPVRASSQSRDDQKDVERKPRNLLRRHPLLSAATALLIIIVLAAATTFLGFAILTFLPVFAQRVFHGGASTYSRLMAFSGAGSIVGALVVAWLGKFRRMGLTALLMQAIYGVLILAFAMSRMMWLSQILLFFTGAALMMVFSTVTSLVQLIAPNEMRGRVMSIYMVAFRRRHAARQPRRRLPRDDHRGAESHRNQRRPPGPGGRLFPPRPQPRSKRSVDH